MGDWDEEIRILEEHGIPLGPGLAAGEAEAAERAHGFALPPDLRSLLAAVVPAAPGFPDWRRPETLRDWLERPLEGVRADVERHGFWWPAWGPRPAALDEALAVARARLAEAPRLVPVYRHRYLPTEPRQAGNPVLSVHGTDVIYYGLDLRRYLRCEFGAMTWREAVEGEPTRIPFWSELVEQG